eukprot:SAG31_NODE_558_length_14153_cov_9.068094_5_plen_78_part_00
MCELAMLFEVTAVQAFKFNTCEMPLFLSSGTCQHGLCSVASYLLLQLLERFLEGITEVLHGAGRRINYEPTPLPALP